MTAGPLTPKERRCCRRRRGLPDPWSAPHPLDLAEYEEIRAGKEAEAAAKEDELRLRMRGKRVQMEAEQLRVRRLARRVVEAEERPPRPDPAPVTLTALLARPDVPVRYRINGLWPVEGKVLLIAQKKAGKTTLVANLARSLVDTGLFLAGGYEGTALTSRDPLAHIDPDQHCGFGVAPLDPDRSVVILDFEMTEQMLKDWYRAERLAHPDRVRLQLLRGSGPWDPRNDEVRAQWAAALRAAACGVLIIDPIGPIMHGLGIDENSNTQVGEFLAALDRLCAEAEVSELLITHHAGHGGERSRGASALLGWPDATWTMTRDADDRFLAAEGRDVFLAERVLTFDPDTRRLGLGARGNREHHRESGHIDVVIQVVADQPGLSVRSLQDAVIAKVRCGTPAARLAIAAAVVAGAVHVHEGPRNARLHFPAASCTGCA